MRTFILGDVHGMLPELRVLLERLSPAPGDHVVSVGDLLDKGPDSAGVMRFLRTLPEQGVGVTLVRGNHEEKHERFRAALKAGRRLDDFAGWEAMQAITGRAFCARHGVSLDVPTGGMASNQSRTSPPPPWGSASRIRPAREPARCKFLS